MRVRQSDAAVQVRMALVHHQQGHLEKAEALYRQVLLLHPKHPDALHLLGVVHHQRGKYAEAVPLIQRAIAADPSQSTYHSNLGNALKELRRLDEALASFDTAIRLQPGNATAFNNRGAVLKEMRRLDDAVASFGKAIVLKPDYALAHNNLGAALLALRRPEEALTCFEEAIRLKPDLADAHNNRGIVLKDLKRVDDALASHEQALMLNPGYAFLPGVVAHSRSVVCRWGDAAPILAAIVQGIAQGRAVAPPFALLALFDDPTLHQMAARIWVAQKLPFHNRLGAIERRAALGSKIHVAYLSADFHEHATSHLMAQLFELHDRSRFELTAISFGPSRDDPVRRRVAAAFDRFEDVRDRSDLEVARLCRELQVDIAVDLKGFTQDSRPGILAERCAPVQINWLGYPGTMAAPFIDYIVADRVVIRPEDTQHYTEKVIWLPGSYQVNDGQRPIAEKAFTRAECNLPEQGFVYCCFNNNYKILPGTFDVWMRVLRRVPESVLWLLADNPTAVRNLRSEAAARGVDPSRLVFAERAPLPEHLARHRVADLVIDTWPYNAHTTASDALWAGVPVLTRSGRSFASRVAASLLHAIGLEEMITTRDEDFEELAVSLARDATRLGAARAKLAAHRRTYPLFDCERFARHLESAYEEVLRRHCHGAQTEHLDIEAGLHAPAAASRSG